MYYYISGNILYRSYLMKKSIFTILILTISIVMILSGCGSDTNDTQKVSNMRILLTGDTVTLKETNEESASYNTTYKYTAATVNIQTDTGKTIIAEMPKETIAPAATTKKVDGTYNYSNCVQYADGSIAEVAGTINENKTEIQITYNNILCEGTLKVGNTWQSEGITYKVLAYEYVKTVPEVMNCYRISVSGNGIDKEVWWCPSLGFCAKEESDISSLILSEYSL